MEEGKKNVFNSMTISHSIAQVLLIPAFLV